MLKNKHLIFLSAFILQIHTLTYNSFESDNSSDPENSWSDFSNEELYDHYQEVYTTYENFDHPDNLRNAINELETELRGRGCHD